jgi:hypothetical protein
VFDLVMAGLLIGDRGYEQLISRNLSNGIGIFAVPARAKSHGVTHYS